MPSRRVHVFQDQHDRRVRPVAAAGNLRRSQPRLYSQPEGAEATPPRGTRSGKDLLNGRLHPFGRRPPAPPQFSQRGLLPPPPARGPASASAPRHGPSRGARPPKTRSAPPDSFRKRTPPPALRRLPPTGDAVREMRVCPANTETTTTETETDTTTEVGDGRGGQTPCGDRAGGRADDAESGDESPHSRENGRRSPHSGNPQPGRRGPKRHPVPAEIPCSPVPGMVQ